MIRLLISLSLAAFVLGGCSLIPDYDRPALPVAPAYADTVAVAKEPLNNPECKHFFQDPALQSLIDIAIANNRDLRVASLNVQAFKAQYRIQHADIFPDLSATAGSTRQRVPGDLNSSGKGTIESQYSVGLQVSYELDVFGRLRSLDQAALEHFLATAYAQRSVQISLVASVASVWSTLQADTALLQLTDETLDNYEKSLNLTQHTYEAGAASALAVSQATTLVQGARSAQARYRRQVAQDNNLLTLLLGQSLPANLTVQAWDTQHLPELPVGLPSDLLTRRPDILEAEHRLKASNANIGAARAAFFPRITLTGGAGTSSAQMGGLFDGGSGTWHFAPQLALPIFNAGALRASLDVAKVEKDMDVARYQKAIQTAFREVNDGLAARQTYRQQIAAQQMLVDTSRHYVQLAEHRFTAGIDSSLTLLDAQRTLFAAQQELVSDQLAGRVATIGLFKALGGGWTPDSLTNLAKSAD